MIAKYWQKVGLIVVVIACLFNIVNKLVHKASMKQEVEASAEYVEQRQNANEQK